MLSEVALLMKLFFDEIVAFSMEVDDAKKLVSMIKHDLMASVFVFALLSGYTSPQAPKKENTAKASIC